MGLEIVTFAIVTSGSERHGTDLLLTFVGMFLSNNAEQLVINYCPDVRVVTCRALWAIQRQEAQDGCL
jgi:hypothetical protein